jgi:hypothetical protein
MRSRCYFCWWVLWSSKGGTARLPLTELPCCMYKSWIGRQAQYSNYKRHCWLESWWSFHSVSECMRERVIDIQLDRSLIAAASAFESDVKYPAQIPAPADMSGLGWSLMPVSRITDIARILLTEWRDEGLKEYSIIKIFTGEFLITTHRGHGSEKLSAPYDDAPATLEVATTRKQYLTSDRQTDIESSTFHLPRELAGTL